MRLHTAALEQQLRQLQTEVAARRTDARRGPGGGANSVSLPARHGHRGSGPAALTGGSMGVKQAFMDLVKAIAAGHPAERDALLPLVGMQLGASPVECLEMTRLMAAGSRAGTVRLW